MKKLILLTFCALLLGACVSPPEKKPISLPVARAIHLEKEQKVLCYNRAFDEYYIVGAGTYKLIGEDKDAWYYANDKEVIRVKNLYPERTEKGGIGLSKANGNYFMYLAKELNQARRQVESTAGAIWTIGMKSTLNDGFYRFFMSWVTFDYVAAWTFEPEFIETPASPAVPPPAEPAPSRP